MSTRQPLTSRSQVRDTSRILRIAAFAGAFSVLHPIVDAQPRRPRAPAGQTARARSAYGPNVNPFEPDSRIVAVARAALAQTSPRAQVQAVFDALHRGGSQAVRFTEGSTMPTTAIEGMRDGADCTGAGNAFISAIFELNRNGANMTGGALVIHSRNAPATLFHMIPFVNLGGQRVVADLQAGAMGQTPAAPYDVVVTYTSFEQAAAMYHREAGDSLHDRQDWAGARAAYERSLQIFEGDAHVHIRLARAFEQLGEMAQAATHNQRAAELNPRFNATPRTARMSYNELTRRGMEAFRARRWTECAQLFRAARDSGERISADERAALQDNISACEENARP